MLNFRICLVILLYTTAESIGGTSSHTCPITVYLKEKTTTKCGLFNWRKCTRYRSVSHTTYPCCDGYTSYRWSWPGSGRCSYAICNGKINPRGACNQKYAADFIKYRSDRKEYNSGGRCDKPETCVDCHDGFYSNNGKCTICPKIPHCWHRNCTTTADNICSYCDGEVIPKKNWRAYTSDTDNQKSCQKACSWRADSTRCYPGKCTRETVDSCECMAGFTGPHCNTIVTQPTIVYQLTKIHSGTQTKEITADPKAYSDPEPTIWSNFPIVHYVETYFTGIFKITFTLNEAERPSHNGSTHFITDYQSGITDGRVTVTRKRGSSRLESIHSNCGGSRSDPISDQYDCNKNKKVHVSWPMIHRDEILIDMSLTNGGFVKVLNREKDNKHETFYLKGKTLLRHYKYQFDLEKPYHVCTRSTSMTCEQALVTPDLTEDYGSTYMPYMKKLTLLGQSHFRGAQANLLKHGERTIDADEKPSVTFSWDLGWTDDLSGLAYFAVDVLLEGIPIISDDNISITQQTVTFTLTTPDMYTILLHAYDKADNKQSARRVFLFDNKSVVEKHANKYGFATTASVNTTYKWVVIDTNAVNVEWSGLFFNKRHSDNRWLNSIQPYPGMDPSYDDNFGDRTTQRIENVAGIVDFWISFKVYTNDNSVKDSRPFNSTKLVQDHTLTVNWEDGDKLNITIRAIDVMKKYAEEHVIVYRDATAPVIYDLWLTHGNRGNVSVHTIEDFTQMTIEWYTYDYHSGIDSLYWKLYDNFTDDVIMHGHEDLISQSTKNLSSCQTSYGGQSNHCYCTAFYGCFHKHFRVKPDVKVGGGLIVGKDRGTHDFDYYIDVQVTNNANLVTTLSKKITIDVTPPHVGVVHDGVVGTPEVDFQQSYVLNAHWDGFFDRESGVKMYVYTFAVSCQTAGDMVLDSSNPSVIETVSTHASHSVVAEGTYFVTVVAFNYALDPSTPVCSDGVTVDSSSSAVREISIETAMVKGGLVTNTDNSGVWVMATDRTLRQLTSPSNACQAKATVVSNLELYPRERHQNLSAVFVDGLAFCDNTSATPSPVIAVLRKSSSLTVSWVVSPEGKSEVFDHEFGIARTYSGQSAPAILAYISTKQHPHIIVQHTDLPTGLEFYIAIKTISKSEVENIQVLGPFIVDTTAASVSGEVTLNFVSEHLVATWIPNVFFDSEEYHGLFYSFAIGHTEYGSDVQNFMTLKGGATCVLDTPPGCTASRVNDLDWDLHGHHIYFVTIKAENSVGLFVTATSNAYIHDVQLAAKGVVFDIPFQSNETVVPFTDKEDADFQTDKKTLKARWSRFDHPYLEVTYNVSIGTVSGRSDVYGPVGVGTNQSFVVTGLNLVAWQTYFTTVEAMTSAGGVKVISDGVTIVEESATLSGIKVYDGQPCNSSVDNSSLFKHHDQADNQLCVDDRDFQSSLNSIQAYWTIPRHTRRYTPDIHWAVEEKDVVGAGIWTMVRYFEHLSTANEAAAYDLILLPGRSYRVTLILCAGGHCFAPIHTSGVLILSNPPVTGSLNITHLNTTLGGGTEKLIIEMDRFHDPDIADPLERYEAVERYEWAITDDSTSGKLFTSWTDVVNITLHSRKMLFELPLQHMIDFSRCKRLSVRGYNKAKLSAVVSRQILNCEAYDPKLIVPNIVIDAVGEQQYGDTGYWKDGFGKGIFLRKNARWDTVDVDYTPYMNILSAVWPSLRNRQYTYAVLRDTVEDVTTYYRSPNLLHLPDPCSHPDSIACGHTEEEFVNIEFSGGELQHGYHYMVCIHAEAVEIQQETWLQRLEVVSTCSDGVMVDLTPPIAADLWIGQVKGTQYQTTLSDIFVNWDSFVDVEELGSSSHASGIQAYILSIGSSPGGNDIQDITDVGVVNHAAFHGLTLQHGHTYYASITATDFVGRNVTRVSQGMVVDVTPPHKSDRPIVIDGRHIKSLTEVGACWDGVLSDPESGIQKYKWGIGSRPGYGDVLPFTDVGDVTCAVSAKTSQLNLHEGHAYFITVKAYNGAMLSSKAVSWAYVVDLTAPIPGHVFDGKPHLHPANQRDIDTQTDRSYLAAFWEGFHDAHSSIREYSVSIGTCRGCQDVLGTQAIGITGEFVLTEKHLTVGVRYYTTVTACNTADLCTSVTSDGVILDNSPPTMGVIQDGIQISDIHYQATRTFVGAKWYGFSDPQSGIDHYVWWAGTTRGGAEVMSLKSLHRSEVATNYTVVPALPIGQRIYVTVRAYNKAGLYVDAISNGFTVDTSSPVISKPELSRDLGSIVEGTIVLRTSFKVKWTAADAESYIERQYLSIKSHKGGEFQLSSNKINGIVRDYIFTGLDLHDGVNYYINLIVCNGAGMCSDAESDAIFVDSSPPTRGTFVIETNHATDIQRHTPNAMTWTSRAVHLAWLGFSDLHSSVDYYMINIGSEYMGRDLNQDPDTATMVMHTNISDMYDEGRLQTAKVDTKNLAKTEHLFIHMWVVNKVGLASDVIHSQFRKIAGGALELIRRCEVYSCVGHCVCAPQDRICPYSAMTPCNSAGHSSVSSLEVRDITDLRFLDPLDISHSSTNVVISASWRITNIGKLYPLWFEWSVGYQQMDTPEGVFHQADDRIWHDAGHRMQHVFALPREMDSLKEEISYAFFVRVWYTFDTFAIYKSDGVTIATRPPTPAVVRGSAVTEVNWNYSHKDMDYLAYFPFMVSWANKFLQASSYIEYYMIYLSTTPGGHDVYTATTSIPGTKSSYNFIRFNLRTGVKFYANVVAYSFASVHYTASSDGFVIDDVNPVVGMVYDGTGIHDLEYQSNTTRVGASWHGFEDIGSGVRRYYWCVGDSVRSNECSVRGWKSVGLQTTTLATLASPLAHGVRVYNKVYAVDALGLRSETAVSDGVTVDLSSPIPQTLVHHDQHNLVTNPSFEKSQTSATPWSLSNGTDICRESNINYPQAWESTFDTCVAVLSSDTNLARDGRSMVLVRGTLFQEINGLEKNGTYRVTFVTSHMPFVNSEVANKEGFVEFGERHNFLMYTKTYRQDDHGSETRDTVSWHAHKFYFTVTATTMTLSLGSVGRSTGILIDDVQLHRVTYIDNGTTDTVHPHVIFLHEWGSLHASWKFLEPESHITEYLWAIGYKKGGTQVQTFHSVGQQMFTYNNNVTLVHQSTVYMTVVARNTAGLYGIAYSSPMLVDLSPPVISAVRDGLDNDLDLDSWEQDEILVNWAATDPESGVDFCEWAIGYQPHGNELQSFQRISQDIFSASIRDVTYPKVEGRTVYSTIRCHNFAGQQSASSSDGVRISKRRPSVETAEFGTVGISKTEYGVTPHFQSVGSQLRLQWSGITDNIGLEGYIFVVDGIQRKMLAYEHVQSYVWIHGLNMPDGLHYLTLSAVNLQHKISDKVTTNITISTQRPIMHATIPLTVTWDDKDKALSLSWVGVFTSEYPLYYEVSVGSVPGGGDVVQWLETRASAITFRISPNNVDLASHRLYVVVRAVTPSGMYADKRESVALPSDQQP